MGEGAGDVLWVCVFYGVLSNVFWLDECVRVFQSIDGVQRQCTVWPTEAKSMFVFTAFVVVVVALLFLIPMK